MTSLNHICTFYSEKQTEERFWSRHRPSASRRLQLLRAHESTSHSLLPLGASHEALLARYVCVMVFYLFILVLETETSEQQLHFNRPGVHRAAAWLWRAAPPNRSGSRAVLFPTLLPNPFRFSHIISFLQKQLYANSTLQLLLLTHCCRYSSSRFCPHPPSSA